MAFGVTANGFVRKLEADIESEIKDDQLNEISPGLNQLPTSVLGQLNGIFSDKLRECWELAEAVYRALYPDTATGEALDNVASITGAFRLQSTPSTVTLEVNIDATVTLPVGRLVSSPSTGVQFTTTEAVTNPGPGAGDFPVAAQSVGNGPIAAPAGTLTQIDTPAAGWNSVTNPLDADPGTDRETDAAFRIRREELLRLAGAGTRDSIFSNVRDVVGVTQVVVFENDTDDDNAYGLGLPRHSFEVVALGGSDGDIAQTILDTKPVGITTFGSSSDLATDAQGNSVTINFSRPTTVDMYVDLTVNVMQVDWPLDGEDQIKAAIVAIGDALSIGQDVVINQFLCAAFDVSGVDDVTAIAIEDIPSPTNTANIVIAPREIAVFDTSRITITVVFV